MTKIKLKIMVAHNKRLLIIVLSVVVLLLIPLVAMQFSNEVNWSVFDFLVAGALLLSTGLLIELVIRKVTKRKHRILLFAIILLALLIIWIELSVGVFGSPLAGS
jgi:hypothetical protein